jgi:ABC-type polysaccharide transport system permease subunit
MAEQVDFTPLKKALVDLGVSIVEGMKILVVYIIPSAIVAVLLSPQLMDLLKNNPQTLLYAPIINVALTVVAGLIKARLPKDSAIQEII